MLFWKFRSGSPANQALLLASSSLCGPLKGSAGLRLGQRRLWLHCRRAIASRIQLQPAHHARFRAGARNFSVSPPAAMTKGSTEAPPAAFGLLSELPALDSPAAFTSPAISKFVCPLSRLSVGSFPIA
ncbi:hypothetical protein PMIN01_00823 [Paraphaeosphaeria minitans]|uniref:Uncharacterized protein n=1 Tax=Paraphaeosphaeria minitans TaxID=565426 RepID=A0A9P6GTI5_9PLEO|nr:hypothetical protein PMIN01_00823 [Paraphaeosphaeria minitans]